MSRRRSSAPRARSRYRSLAPPAEVKGSRAYPVRSRRIHGVGAGAPRAFVDDYAIHAQCDLGHVDDAITLETEDFDDGLGRCGSGSAWRRAEASAESTYVPLRSATVHGFVDSDTPGL